MIIRLKVDGFKNLVDVDVRVVKWLHQKGHDAAYLREEGLHWMPNVQVAGRCYIQIRSGFYVSEEI